MVSGDNALDFDVQRIYIEKEKEITRISVEDIFFFFLFVLFGMEKEIKRLFQ